MTKVTSREANPIGQRLKALRKEHDWTLSDVSKRTGISMATLSKVENGRTDMNFTSVNKLAEGLKLPVTDLTNPQPAATGRRDITTGGNGVIFHIPDVEYEVLCSEVANQQQCFMKAIIKSRALPAGMRWHRHSGQEFIYVLKGQLELHTELYDPVVLKVGDSILFDSSMGHHYISKGCAETELLISFSLKGYHDASDVILSQHKKQHAGI